MIQVDRKNWLQLRRGGIASSDIPAVCRMSPYRTPLHVYASKVLDEFDEVSDNGPLYWGLRMEGVLGEEYSARTGRAVFKPDAAVCVHESLPHIIATPDFFVDDGRLLELKTAWNSKGWGQPGTDEVPDDYLVQVTHQMLVTGRMVADVAVLIGGNDFRVYTVPFNPGLAETVLQIGSDFWTRHVKPQVVPAPDWTHEDTPKLMAKLSTPFPEKILTADAEALARRYRAIGQQIGDLEKEHDALKASLMGELGGPGVGRMPGGGTIAWKVSRSVRKPQEAKEQSRNLLTVKLEEKS